MDANVLASAFPAPGSIPAQLIERWIAREFQLFLSEHILDGMVRAWHQPYFRARYMHVQGQRALRLLRDRAQIVTPVDTVHGVADDDEDDLVLATAVAAQVPYLVSGDKGLQRLGHVQTIRILSPREFLDLLRQEAASVNDA
ncbi:MAG: putative toxin-antitoxin system toxin component, PIN family [Thermomicrobiales bacterium]